MDILQLDLFDASVEPEVWKPVVGYEGWYEVSSYGRVRNLIAQRAINGWLSSDGYRCVTLGNSKKKQRVHKLVLQSFWGEKPSSNHCCNHIDGNKVNNHLTNLEWVSYSENNRHAYRTGLKQPNTPNPERMRKQAILQSIGGKGNTKLSPDQVREIRALWITGEYSMRALGRQFGIQHNQIGSLLKGKTYTWVD